MLTKAIFPMFLTTIDDIARLSSRCVWDAGISGFYRETGSIYIDSNMAFKEVETLPPNLKACDVTLSSMPSLCAIPPGLQVRDRLILRNLPQITEIPDDLRVSELQLTRCHRVKSLPFGTTTGSLFVTDCASFSDIPAGFQAYGQTYYLGGRCLTSTADLVISKCPSLSILPEGMRIQRNLLISFCHSFVGLPHRMYVGGTIAIRHCRNFEGFPENLGLVRGDLIIEDCLHVVDLPKYLNIYGNLIIKNCPNLNSIHDGINVKGKVIRI